MGENLPPKEIAAQLRPLRGWSRRGKVISRTFTLGSFAGAVKFVRGVARLAERANHHPDMDIRYDRVTLHLTTHDTGGLTMRDMTLAGRINRFFRKEAF